MTTRTPSWVKYLATLTPEERHNILLNLLEHCLDGEDVSYLPDDIDSDEDITWSANGESLRKR